MIIERYERGNKFLDLVRYVMRGMDDDGLPEILEKWECVIWENEDKPDEHDLVEFASESLARLFIGGNRWKLQVL